jgi:hypothetical protein
MPTGRCSLCRGIRLRGIFRLRISSPSEPPDGADAAFLHAAEGGDLASGLGRDDALVDDDDAIFERFADAPDAADVAAVKIAGEPLPSLPGERGRVRVGVSLAILTASASVLKR